MYSHKNIHVDAIDSFYIKKSGLIHVDGKQKKINTPYCIISTFLMSGLIPR